jgi:hypothetical protein
MSDLVYCYHCRKQHPREEMRLIVCNSGKRWRCLTSINAAVKTKNDMASRDAYGKKVTEANKVEAQLIMRLRNAMAKSAA